MIVLNWKFSSKASVLINIIATPLPLLSRTFTSPTNYHTVAIIYLDSPDNRFYFIAVLIRSIFNLYT